MKKALVILMATMLLVFLAAGVALAKDPSDNITGSDDFTYGESGNTPAGSGYNADTPVSAAGAAGASRWSYSDIYGATKREGSYNAFQNQGDQLYDYDATKRDSGPHGGYDTTSNKCKTCHAVHRATGTFALMRVDSPDQACEYCHVGDHRHSVVNAYWQAGTIFPANGHTIGASSEIPDSSVWQWEESINIALADGTNRTARKRHYSPTKNKIMRWVVHAEKFFRVGPISLRCQSCHQPHNALRQVWKPAMSPLARSKYLADGSNPDALWSNTDVAWTRGYKLLRNSPSGGVASADVTGSGYKDAAGTTLTSTSDNRLNPAYLGDSKTDIRLRVPDSTTGNSVADIRPNTVPVNNQAAYKDGNVTYVGGANRTGYTAFRYHSDNLNPGDADWDAYFSDMPIYETSMSFFCADCHNLNIAGKDYVSTEIGVGKYQKGMLGDRSHAVPYMITGRNGNTGSNSGYHCYSCHNNDMPRSKSATVNFDLNADGDSLDAGESLDIATLGGSVTAGCEKCHITSRNYAAFKQTYRQFAGEEGGPSYSDFPHSGPAVGYKLLNSAVTQPGWDTWTDGAGDPTTGEPSAAALREPYTGGDGALDTICLICHGSDRAIGYDK